MPGKRNGSKGEYINDRFIMKIQQRKHYRAALLLTDACRYCTERRCSLSFAVGQRKGGCKNSGG